MIDKRASLPAWTAWALVSGGLLMAGLWVVFTTLHGPTSVDEGRRALGYDLGFWGLLLGVLPNVMIATALLVLKPRFTAPGSRLAGIGYGIVIASLVASAAMDLAVRALGPPFFMPLVGIGMILVALGLRHAPRVRSVTPWIAGFLGLVLLAAFAWALLPLEWSDSVGGYRIFGAIGYLTAGLLWVALGVTVSRRMTAED